MSSTLTPEDIARLQALLNQFLTPATPTMPQLLSSSPASAVQPTGGTSLTRANEGHRGAWQVRVPSNFFFVVMQLIYSLACQNL